MKPNIENLSFKIGEGEFVALIGPSGCGKTTVLSLIAGLLTPTDGKIILNGNEVNGCSNDIGYMLQRDELFPWRTIEKNVFLPLEIKKMNTQKNRDYAISLLDKYGLKDFKNSLHQKKSLKNQIKVNKYNFLSNCAVQHQECSHS